MSLLRADKLANRYNNSGPIIVGPSTVSGNFSVTGILTALGIGVTNNVVVGGALTTKFLTATNSASIFNASLTGITTAGIITNATYFGDGVNLSGIVTEIQPGPGIQISPLTGKGKVTISATGVEVSGYSTSSGIATDVKGGVAGAVLYQAGPNDTAFTAQGNAGEILQSNGATTPTWVNLAAINVSYADSAGISTNLFGGSAGRIPYQSALDQTTFLPIGPTGNLLLGQGTSAPNWIDPKASLDVRYARLSGISTSAIGGVVDVTALKVTGITTLSGGNVEVDNDLLVSGITTTTLLNVGTAATISNLTLSTGPGVGVTAILDEDDMVSDRVDALATQQSIKKYVDDQVTAQDLDGTADTGTFAIDLDTQTLDLRGDTNQVYITASGQTVNVGLDTNVTIPNNLTVTNQTQLSGMTTVSGTLDVNGVTDTQSLNVSGVATVATLGVTGVTTTQSLQVVGVTTTGTLLVGGNTSTPGSTDYSSVTLSGQSSVSFNVTYTRQATGFTLDTGTVSSGNAQFNSNSNYYYYVASSGPQADGRIIIFSEVDNAWVVLLDIGENFTEGNVSDGDALGFVTAEETVTANSTTADGRNVPQASSDIVYATSGGGTTTGIGVTITTDGNAIFAGIVTASTLNVTGQSTLGVTTTTDLSSNQLVVAGLTTLAVNGGITTTGGDLYVGGNIFVKEDIVFDEVVGRNLNITGVGTINTLGVTGVTTTQFLEVTGVSTLTGYVGVGSGLVVAGVATFLGSVDIGVGATINNANLYNANLTGVTTVATLGVTGITTVGILTAYGNVELTQDLEVEGHTILDTVHVSGMATFRGGIDIGTGTTIRNAVLHNTNLTGVTTVATLGVTGVTTTQFLEVTGVSTLTGYVGIGSGLVVTGTGVTATTLNVSGVSTVGFLTVTDSLYVSGIASVGSAITMYGATGIISATSFYGDGSNLTGVVGLVSVTNQLYVTPDGNDENDGYLVSTAKRTVGSALTVATPSTVVNIAAGNYTENNPIILPEQVTLLGDSLREVSMIPQNKDEDFIYVSNGSYVENMSFTGTLNEGKAIISFNPDVPSFITQGPYIRNCTNFISNSIGLKVDGSDALGATRAMNVDSYTQLNQGGIGVSISNEGYAQLVSIFTIYNDQSIVCVSGGQCDLTNSNSSFGRLGLVADGVGPTNFIGTVTEFTSANTNVFPIDVSTETISVENAEYDHVTGLTTITTYKPNNFTKGMSVNISGLGFTCPPDTSTFVVGQSIANVETTTGTRFTAGSGTTYDPATGLLVLDIGIGHGLTAQTDFTATTGTTYNPTTGVLTVVTTNSHGMITGTYVKFAPDSLTFSCDKDGNATNHTYPRATDPIYNMWKQVTVVDATTFQMDVGVSSDVSTHTFVSATANGVKVATKTVSIVDGSLIFTCATDGNTTQHAYPRLTDPASGRVFGIEAISSTSITLNIGLSSDTSVHTFVLGVTDAVVERARGTAFSAITGTTYDDATGLLLVDTGTSTSALTAPTGLTATAGTLYVPNTGTLRIVTTTPHGMTTGDIVKINQEAITFVCESDSYGSQVSYPRITDPIFNQWVQTTVIDATTFDINVGPTVTGDYQHIFVSCTAGGILLANSVLNIVDDAFTFTCSRDNNTTQKSYPRFTDPLSNKFVGIEAVAGNTFTVNIGQANIATFPDNFGRVFQVNSVIAGAGTSFTTYVGVSTIQHTYNSGGNTNIFVTRPYDGQVVYFDSIYNSIENVTITNGGGGYTEAPQVEFSNPSESWGIKATGTAILSNGSVTGIQMISNGRGYTGTPTVTIPGGATGTANILPTYYVVNRATPIVAGVSTVTFTENVPYAVGVGITVPFFKQSRVLASSQAFEYIGSGNTALTALPQRGGIAIPENEIVNKNGGLVIYTSTDQAGNFKIGNGVIINQLEGSVSGGDYNRSLFANITPYILALGGE